MIKAIEDGLYNPSMKTRMEELEAQKEGLQADIEREEINRQIVTRDEMLFFLRQFMDGDPNDPAYRHRLVDTFINSIWLYDDKIVFTYNYSGEGSTVTLDMVDIAIESEENECSTNACHTPPNETKANTVIICAGVFGFVKEIADRL